MPEKMDCLIQHLLICCLYTKEININSSGRNTSAVAIITAVISKAMFIEIIKEILKLVFQRLTTFLSLMKLNKMDIERYLNKMNWRETTILGGYLSSYHEKINCD